MIYDLIARPRVVAVLALTGLPAQLTNNIVYWTETDSSTIHGSQAKERLSRILQKYADTLIITELVNLMERVLGELTELFSATHEIYLCFYFSKK